MVKELELVVIAVSKEEEKKNNKARDSRYGITASTFPNVISFRCQRRTAGKTRDQDSSGGVKSWNKYNHRPTIRLTH